MSRLVLRNEHDMWVEATMIEETDEPEWDVRLPSPLPNGTIEFSTFAQMGLLNATITDDLCSLLVRCLARDEANRPTLDEALAICQNAVLVKSENDYVNELAGPNSPTIYESDWGVGHVVSQLVLSAEVTEEEMLLKQGRRTTWIPKTAAEQGQAKMEREIRRKKRQLSAADMYERNLREILTPRSPLNP